MTIDSWHAPDDLLHGFATVPEAVDPTTASSVEQHLMGCAHCRAVVADATSSDELEALWTDIADAVDRRPVGRLGRLLAAFGLDRPAIRLVAATGLLRVQALAVVLVLAVGAATAAQHVDTSTPFYVVAPLVVLAVVVVGFHPALEAAGEVALATPLFGFRLFCTRAVVVLATTMLPLAAASVLLPASGWEAFAWVLPTLALASVALALGTRYPPSTAGAGLGVAWLAALGLQRWIDARPPTMDWMLDPLTQVLAAALVAGSFAVIVLRRGTFDHPAPTRGELWP